MSEKPGPRTIAWRGLTEADAEGGGEVLMGPKGMGPGSAYAVIRDPAGAVSALYQVGS
jgi:predicted enzyme related to lactoylglutathione lyase